jgi:hypothetical protein
MAEVAAVAAFEPPVPHRMPKMVAVMEVAVAAVGCSPQLPLKRSQEAEVPVAVVVAVYLQQLPPVRAKAEAAEVVALLAEVVVVGACSQRSREVKPRVVVAAAEEEVLLVAGCLLQSRQVKTRVVVQVEVEGAMRHLLKVSRSNRRRVAWSGSWTTRRRTWKICGPSTVVQERVEDRTNSSTRWESLRKSQRGI